VRNTADYTVTSEGRDKGKVFRITEMSATQGEMWAARVFLALAKSNVEIPDEIEDMGMAGLASLTLKSLKGVSFEDAKPLLDEMFKCVQLVPDARHPQVTRPLIEDDIEEIGTRLQLRREVLHLHLGSFPLAGPLKSAMSRGTANDTPATATSQGQSVQ